MNPRFDAYTATFKMADSKLVYPVFFDHQILGDEWTDGPGYHGFEKKESFKGADGTEWASLLYGGKQGDRIMFETKGERAPEIIKHLREVVPVHRCTRVDSCIDYDNGPGTWEAIDAASLATKEKFNLYGEIRGDWSQPDKGRTRMVGAPTSPARWRNYEKGKQSHLLHLAMPNLVRVECQVRPRGTARDRYSTITPLEVWSATPSLRHLAGLLLNLDLPAIPCGTVYREANRERALRWMAKQYGAQLLSLLSDVGDWECVGRQIETFIADAKRLEAFKAKDKALGH